MFGKEVQVSLHLAMLLIDGRMATVEEMPRYFHNNLSRGQTDVPGNPKFYSRQVTTSANSASSYATLNQKLEGVRTFAGQTVTISFYAKADAVKNIAIEPYQNFGTG